MASGDRYHPKVISRLEGDTRLLWNPYRDLRIRGREDIAVRAVCVAFYNRHSNPILVFNNGSAMMESRQRLRDRTKGAPLIEGFSKV